MALDAIEAEGQRTVAVRRVAGQLDVHPEALRSWVKRTRSTRARRRGARARTRGVGGRYGDHGLSEHVFIRG